MQITKFKRRLNGDGEDRIICGVRPDANIAVCELGHFASDMSNRYTISDCRNMRIAFFTDEKNFDGYIEVDAYDELVDNYSLNQDYIDVIHEPSPALKLVQVTVSRGYIALYVVAFDSEDGSTEDAFIHFKNLPAHVKIKVDVDAGFGYNAESYLIINKKTAEATENDYVIEKYENGVLKRISEFGKDDSGEYELITIIV